MTSLGMIIISKDDLGGDLDLVQIFSLVRVRSSITPEFHKLEHS